jgi:hypothetical protein
MLGDSSSSPADATNFFSGKRCINDNPPNPGVLTPPIQGVLTPPFRLILIPPVSGGLNPRILGSTFQGVFST